MEQTKRTFEQNMKELEALTALLESGEAPLETMISRYEQGVALYRACREELDGYEKRLKALAEAEE